MKVSLVVAAFFSVQCAAVRQASSESAPFFPVDDHQQASEYFQCTRQCRWYHGFFSSNIVGKRTAILSGFFDGLGRYCTCYEGGRQLGKPIIRFSKKKFDTVTTWSGSGNTGFDSDLVCVESLQGTLGTMTTDEARAAVAQNSGTALHCGRCSACSARKDIEVLARTRRWITQVLTKVGARYAAPWGHGNSTRLADEIEAAGIGFSRTRMDGRTDLPTCMDVWADNVMCDAATCKSKCWSKFFNSGNTKTTITDPKWWQLNAQCLKCDEDNCGPAFIKGAGANRRSSGIESDIARPEWQKCHVGLFSGVADELIPTDPKH